MGPSLQIADDRWVNPCDRPRLSAPTEHVRPHTRAVAASLVQALVCWQAKRLERRIERFERDCRNPI